MSIHVALHHKTHYQYDRLVTLGPQTVRLRPAPHSRTRILSYSLKVRPENHFINWQQDPQSNYAARLVFEQPTREFLVEVDLVAEMAVLNPFDFFLEPGAQKFPFAYDPALDHELAPFNRKCWLTPNFMRYLTELRRDLIGEVKRRTKKERLEMPDKEKKPTNDFIVAINQRLWKAIKYTIRMEPGVQTPEETLTKMSGSCRDSAWLLVQLLRHFGLAARFVSGYLIQLKADVKSLDGPSGAEKDFTDLHAWTEVYLPGAGWIGLDPTSGLLAGEGHIPLACTPDPSSAAPISGGVDECETEFGFDMTVKRVYESPRVTLPYTDEQWEKIESLGHAIDRDLKKGDVRLTMGGEPTFVSIDDPDGAEWNFTAVSHKKRILSGELIKRLRKQFAPGSLLHYGQGKWYPGEPLPRYALAAYWRKDGVPVWKDDSLIADESKNYGHGAKDAKELLSRLAALVGGDPKHLIPAYEDAFYYTWKERRFPTNVTPEKSNLKDKQERERISRIFQQGLGSVVGYALPIKRVPGGWMSGSWFLRDDDTLWLIPGDSPMGLRLPLDSVPWVAEKDFPWLRQQDPSNPKLPELPKEFPYRQRFVGRAAAPTQPGEGRGQRAQKLGEKRKPLEPLPPDENPLRRPATGQSAPWIIRTALCVEPRDGRLHLFMPPVETTEDYLDLIAGIETVVTEMGAPVIIEGETPPRDPRLNKLAVTPDPGVIEVNMHPSKTWDELVHRTEILYEEARQTRLGTEKFMLDGRHTGTGGGNHIIIGAEAPPDSPVLRRPDLLRSLLGYWQNHPSLSWLFSGLFVGPTSQAPRIDEARNDSLYELEVAFKEMDRQIGAFGQTPPWMVDRLFRNLLIDASGNTHRSEFSIDKLYAPESSSGRLGLVEMRAFEMPPHARMSLAQHLVLRGLVSKFWKEPYKNDLVRWGTDIHDRWMLPHFCETDFRDVIHDLRESGYPFEFDWFAPHFEFRFPRIGDLEQRDIQLELRTALEPWHVLGEEPGGGGTVRYVDSSLERLQVKANGLAGDRFAITCNGHRVPLHPTGTNGEAVAGVRYRAWQPPVCLQPTIGSHAPLRFDLYDIWNQRSLGGCTYHVAHPGGRGYDTFPVNSYEAESRRLSRFFRHGHQQGKFTPPPKTRMATSRSRSICVMSDASDNQNRREQPPMTQSQSQFTPGDTSLAKKAALEKLLSGYRRNVGTFDELLARDGEIFSHYAKLLGALEEFGPAELARRADASQRFVQEQGITYNVYGDPRGMERPWQLDPIPLVIAPAEWQALETGLVQRATLLNKILADCYGAQELIRSRWLSPALVFGQPDFLRPCHGIRVPGDVFLHFYAADLARSPDGRWWVVSDRTQIPTGAGYALANRVITSRILPEPFRDNHVHRLAGFFLAVQDSLAQLAPRQADKTRAVMLTPGPHNETYFEQAYLARYLGYMLVEGQDLTVRDNHVFLKTLSGLERVDVILRRVDDDFSDPLELRNDSILGVPGLVEAVRAGNVVVANALGSGLVQSPAFMSFLPGLCGHLLGEKLQLPSVATWWSGQKDAREYIFEHLDELVVKPAFRTHVNPAGAARDELKRRIEFDPDLFVAQERVIFSTAPAWEKNSLAAQPVSLRVFLVADGRGGYSVMPGGLARIAPDSAGEFVTMQSGGSSKDTWIPSTSPVEEFTLLYTSGQNVELRRTGNNLPSRLADNFFWIGRYSERADATARLLRSALLRFNPERTGGAKPLIAPLLQTLEIQGQLPGISAKPELWANAEAFEAELLAAIFDPARAGSLRQTAEQLQRLAMLVRDRTSNDMWRVLSQIDDRLATPASSLVMLAGEAVGVLNQTLIGLAAFHGLARENMTRAQAWRFLDMGLRLERAVYISTLLDATLRSPEAENPSLLEAVLEVVDSSITFRSRYNLLPTVPAVFDLVLLDDKNPRSVLFQIRQLAKHFERLPKERGQTASPGKTVLDSCLARLERADARELVGLSANWGDSTLAGIIQATLRVLPQLSDAIAANYFAHSAISRTGRDFSQ